MTDQYFTEPAERNRQMAKVLAYLQQRDAMDRQLTVDDALNAANFARYHVDPNPELAATVAAAGIPFDDPALSEIVRRDVDQQNDDWWEKVRNPIWNTVKGGVRGTTTYLEALWEEGISRPTRTGILAYQGDTDGVVDSWRSAGSSDLAMVAGERSQGNRVNIGSGFFAKSDTALGNQAFRDNTIDYARENVEQQQALGGAVDPVLAVEEGRDQAQQEYYGEFGKPITYEGQRTRESTIIQGASGYKTPFSFGRAAAVQVSAPGTVPFNTISGAIDGAARLVLDPVNIPASEVAAAFKARSMLIPARIEDAGAYKSWRPWVRPEKADDWLRRTDKGGGDELARYLADTTDFNDVNALIPDMPLQTRLDVLDAKTADDVRQALKPQLGVTQKVKPNLARRQRGALESRVDNVDGSVSKFVDEGQSNWASNFKQRYSAQSGSHIMNPYDADGSIRVSQSWLDTINAPASVKAQVAETIAREPGLPGIRKAQRQMKEQLRVRLEELYGKGDKNVALVDEIMEDFENLEQLNRSYLHDMAGNNMMEGHQTMSVWDPEANKLVEVRIDSAHLDSEMASQMVSLPRIREIREATNSIRVWRNKVGFHFGDDAVTGTSALFAKGDTAMTLWRNFALLRPAWTLRVIPEELLRQGAAGYSEILMHPGSYFSLMAGKPGKFETMLSGTDEAIDVFNLENMGAGAFLRDKQNQALVGTRFDASRSSWQTVKTVDHTGAVTLQGQIGLGREYMQLYGSELATHVATHGVDEAVRILKETPEGRAILEDIARNALPDSELSKLKGEHALRRHLESVDARITMQTGGDVVYFDEIDQVWRHGNTSTAKKLDGTPQFNAGQAIDDPATWSKKQQIQALQESKYPGRSKLRNSEQRAAVLREQNGIPVMEDIGSQKFITVREGRADLRRMIADGTDAAGEVRIKPKMTKKEIRAMEKYLPTQFDDVYPIPEVVKAPSMDAAKAARAGKDVVDNIYAAFMQMPTTKVVRGPFAKLRYVDEVSDFYLFADDATRARINAWAKSNDMQTELINSVRNKARDRGVKINATTNDLDKMAGSLPKPKGNPFGFDEIDAYARAAALDTTKKLFYDLAEKGNWADSMRLVAPFADAWAEVLTRWAKMLDPTGISTGGMRLAGFGAEAQTLAGSVRAVRNWQRGSTAVDALRSNGFFHENEFGQEVMSFPGVSSFIPGMSELGGASQTEIGLSSLLFVGGDARGTLGPSVGPLVQIPASYAQPLVKNWPFARNAMNWLAYGDFAPGDVDDSGTLIKTPMPTWMKRTFELVTGEENKRVVGDEVAQWYMALRQGPDVRYNAKGPEAEQRAMERAREIGNQYMFMRVFDSIVMPANPRYLPGFVKDASAQGKYANTWMTVAAVNSEFQSALQVFGDQAMARNYVAEKFGYDPLGLTGKTNKVKERPLNESEWQYLQDHDELRQLDLLMMAFIPSEEENPFYYPAWRDAESEGAFEYLDPETSRRMINQQLASAEWQQVTEDHEAALKQAETRFGKSSASYRQYRDVTLHNWKQNRKKSIAAQYMGFWNPDQPFEQVYGSLKRPTKGDMWAELEAIGSPGSPKNLVARSADTDEANEMATFIEFIVQDMWPQMEAQSIERSNDASWWRTSYAESPGSRKTLYEAEHMRQWFVDGMQQHIEGMQTADGQANARWLADTVMDRLIVGRDWDEDLFLIPSEPPAPGRPLPGDKMFEESTVPNPLELP